MRVLYICGRIKPEVRGGTDLRIRGQIKVLSELSELAVFSIEYSEAQPIAGVEIWASERVTEEDQFITDRKYIKAVTIDGADPYYHRYSKKIEAKLKNLVDNFQPEVIIFSKLPQTPYLKIIKSCSSAYLVLDLDESSRQVMSSIGSIMEHPVSKLINTKIFESICKYETSILSQFNKIWVCSSLEVSHLKNQYGHDLPVVSIPNAIDLENYSFDTTRENRTIIYPADFGYFPNEHASNFIVNELIPLMPDFDFKFVGTNFPTWMLDLNVTNIEIVRNVPAMAPYLLKAGMMVIPLKAGAGTRLKALEAFASKLPVVSTKLGIEGLDVKDGEHVLIAETPAEFASQCNRLNSDPKLAATLTKNAHFFADSFFSTTLLKELIKAELTGATCE
jgi:glycosyltransferase involved in cell wall biosynthesis